VERKEKSVRRLGGDGKGEDRGTHCTAVLGLLIFFCIVRVQNLMNVSRRSQQETSAYSV